MMKFPEQISMRSFLSSLQMHQVMFWKLHWASKREKRESLVHGVATELLHGFHSNYRVV